MPLWVDETDALLACDYWYDAKLYVHHLRLSGMRETLRKRPHGVRLLLRPKAHTR